MSGDTTVYPESNLGRTTQSTIRNGLLLSFPFLQAGTCYGRTVQMNTSMLPKSPTWLLLSVTSGTTQFLGPLVSDQATLSPSLVGHHSVSTLNGLIRGVGTDIWAYGMSGPDQGTYSATLDNHTMGQYTAQAAEVDYHHLLFAAHDLDDGKIHYLTLTNTQKEASLAFDYALISIGDHNAGSVSPLV
jgi:hypothetical protein